jgi:ubiquinone/menaquinone biosynthesis C-methylase UbiE
MPSDFDSRAREWDGDPKRTARANAVADAIRAAVPLDPAMTAFEFGCGTGLLSFALHADLGAITLADTSTGMLEVLAEKIIAAGIANMTPLRIDLATDPLPPARFDLIYTLMTLHHVRDTSAILNAFHTLLNPGGHLCIADLDQEDGSFHVHEPGFDGHNGFERTVLAAQLTQAGFTNTRFSTCFEMNKDGRVYPLFLAVANNVKRDS